MKKLILFIIISLVVGISGDLFAQKKGGKKSSFKVVKEYEKRTVLDFEGATLEGAFKKPPAQLIQKSRAKGLESLSIMRTNFKSEILQSVGSMSKKKAKNVL